MAPQLTEDEVDDLIYFARAGEETDFAQSLSALATRESVAPAQVLMAARDEGRSTTLHMATGNGHLAIVGSVLAAFDSQSESEKKAFIDATNEYGNTGLHWAAMNGHLDVVKLLMEAGASPALANDKNYIPLDLASFNDKIEVVDYFLSRSGDMEGENSEGLDDAVVDVALNDDHGEEKAADGAEAETETETETKGNV